MQSPFSCFEYLLERSIVKELQGFVLQNGKRLLFNFFPPESNCLSIHLLLLLLTSYCAALSLEGKGKWKLISCPWRWKPQYPGGLALFRSIFPMQSSLFSSKNDARLFPHRLHPVQRALPLPDIHFLCHPSHHLKDAPHWAGCSPRRLPLGALCLFPL